ncbi:TPA: hypothetical protein KPF99_003498 [Clostridioides difficile]|uniref:Uncharacterized protein n=1 Tax=Clostridioides difficile TaxID=1496 RepID=A0A9X8RLH7_CLODI|nr:hypothetical protein [Clostridioides difficile]EGT4929429.1 hypothetical protein [Clostridioides difficile]EKS6785881.1 hypothetical protein [Clostridioides difficile]EQH15528.1 hypothetical protein QKW_3890 [Clostridioides difficile DA00210]MBY1331353.1 hypothetical protein [Clostridioides difficile]MBY2568624.1 hypothetical protein [Clostridioides difficile]
MKIMSISIDLLLKNMCICILDNGHIRELSNRDIIADKFIFEIYKIFNNHNCDKLVLDISGIGIAYYQNLEEHIDKNKLIGVYLAEKNNSNKILMNFLNNESFYNLGLEICVKNNGGRIYPDMSKYDEIERGIIECIMLANYYSNLLIESE